MGSGLFSSVQRSTDLGLGRLGGMEVFGAAVALVVVAALAFANGGYGSSSWGWSGLVLLWVAALVVALGTDVRLGGLELTALLGFTGVLAWTLLSNIWTLSPTRTVLEGERTLVYVSGLAALLLVGRRRTTAHC